MPRRSDREEFKHAFGENPFEGKTPEEIYKLIQWGNNPTEIIEIDAPEAIISLGLLAKLYLTNGNCVKFRKGSYHLAIGENSNQLYAFPKGNTTIPQRGWEYTNVKVKRTDYHSKKGGEDCYYYHNHERPYPGLIFHPRGLYILVPQRFKGQRSYAVIKEGIVG